MLTSRSIILCSGFAITVSMEFSILISQFWKNDSELLKRKVRLKFGFTIKHEILTKKANIALEGLSIFFGKSKNWAL